MELVGGWAEGDDVLNAAAKASSLVAVPALAGTLPQLTMRCIGE